MTVGDLGDAIDKMITDVPEEAWDTVPDSNGWMSIKSAPKDGRHILVATKGGVDIAYWCTWKIERWQPIRATFGRVDATHWMPLPNRPKE